MLDTAYYKPLISLLVGIILIFLIKGRNERKKKILSDCIEVPGTVIDQSLEYSGSLNTGTGLYYPILAFNLKDGTSMVKKYTDGYSPAKYKINQEVIIQYSVKEPKDFLIKGDNAKWLETGVVLFGSALIVYGVFSIYQVYIAAHQV